MGIDAKFWIRAKVDVPSFEWPLPDYVKLKPKREYHPPQATHHIDVPWRYYGEHYERGPWPYMAALLMTLFSSEDVDAVWYGSDNDDYDTIEPITIDRVNEISAYFMKYGNRPYRGIKTEKL